MGWWNSRKLLGKNGGITEEEWYKWQTWKCDKYNYQDSNFTEFIKECIWMKNFLS